MRFSERHIIKNLYRRNITLEPAIEVVNNPVMSQVRADGRIRYWGYVEAIGHYIRVVVEPNGVEIVTAFPDSSYRP